MSFLNPLRKLFGLKPPVASRRKLLKQLHETVAFVHKRLRIDRDLLSDRDIELLHVTADEAEMETWIRSPAEIKAAIDRLTRAYEKVFPALPGRGLRENGEVVLVALLVAMTFRAYFLQPFRIPTGSMQPTLYGITPEAREGNPPSAVRQVVELALLGRKYVHVVAKSEGPIRGQLRFMGGSTRFVPETFEIRWPIGILNWLLPRSGFMIGDRTYTVWTGRPELTKMLGEVDGNGERIFKPGEQVLNHEVISGDHLFVDRFSYNFVRPKRGDIFVFETRDLPVQVGGQFYIKRCVGLPGETISIGDDDRLVVDGVSVSPEGPFAKIYSKKGGYYGHLNFQRMRQLSNAEGLTPFNHLLDSSDTFTIPEHAYWAMGDNTRSSYDSRYAGPILEKALVGRAFFVYWPFGSRWGVPE